jgi:hypothetical protein
MKIFFRSINEATNSNDHNHQSVELQVCSFGVNAIIFHQLGNSTGQPLSPSHAVRCFPVTRWSRSLEAHSTVPRHSVASYLCPLQHQRYFASTEKDSILVLQKLGLPSPRIEYGQRFAR